MNKLVASKALDKFQQIDSKKDDQESFAFSSDISDHQFSLEQIAETNKELQKRISVKNDGTLIENQSDSTLIARGKSNFIPTLDFDAFSFTDFKNLHKMKKFNPNNESFSFSENDLPSNLNIDDDEYDK